jgi:hypothetical protein
MKKCFLLCILFASPAFADIIFESWHKIEAANVHVGYTVIRYEYLPAKKQFQYTSFLKTNEAGGSVTESLKAFAKEEDFEPISYQYTSIVGNDTKTIDATYKKGTLYATVKDNKTSTQVQNKLSDKPFFSAFLPLKLLKKGMKVGDAWKYKAIAEESAKEEDGRLEVKEQTKLGTTDAFRVINDFAKYRFNSFVSFKGEIIATKSPITGISTEMVPTSSAAIGNIPFNAGTIKSLFGYIPGPKADLPTESTMGIVPAKAPSKQEVLQKKPLPIDRKGQGVAPGQGIQIKNKTDGK